KTGHFTQLTLPYPIGAVGKVKAIPLPKIFETKSIGYKYNFIQQEVKETWLNDGNRIFYLQCGNQEKFNQAILDNYHEIENFERVYNIEFIYHPRLIEKNTSKQENDFLHDTGKMHPDSFYNELAKQVFGGKEIIDPVY